MSLHLLSVTLPTKQDEQVFKYVGMYGTFLLQILINDLKFTLKTCIPIVTHQHEPLASTVGNARLLFAHAVLIYMRNVY